MFDGSSSEAGNGSMAFCKPYLGQLIVRSLYEVGQSGSQASLVIICDAVTVVAGVPCYSPFWLIQMGVHGNVPYGQGKEKVRWPAARIQVAGCKNSGGRLQEVRFHRRVK